jgi:hypothetical protein
MNEEVNFKPTLKDPVNNQSKGFEKNFKKTVTKFNPGMKVNETDTLLSETEFSLKKKIFSLPKMEALVFSDPKLTAVYDDMSEEGEEKYGYHYNETIMNMIFNDYILNSPKYLQKYRMAIPKEKKRRDKSGINQLRKAGEKTMKNPTFKVKEPTKAELAEDSKKRFGGLYPVRVMFLVNESDPQNLDVFAYFPEENYDNAGKLKTGYSHIGQHSAVSPEYAAESRLATPEEYADLKAELESIGYNLEILDQHPTYKGTNETTGAASSGAYSGPAAWKKGGDLMENEPDEEETDQPQDDDCFIESNGFKYSVSCGGKFQGEFVEMDIALAKVKEWKQKNNFYPNTWFVSDHGNVSLIDDEGNILKETSTTGSVGGAGMGSGGYSTPYAWGGGDLMKGKKGKVMRKPIWPGGTLIQETNYLTETEGFEKYVQALNEDIDLSYQEKLGDDYDQSHNASNNGLGVSEIPTTPERDALKTDIDANTELYVGQDVDRMPDKDVEILHNDMVDKNSMFPHPENKNLPEDGISGAQAATQTGKPFTINIGDERNTMNNTIIDKTTAFTSDAVKGWNGTDAKIEMDTLATGQPDKPNLNLMEQQIQPPSKISTPEELKAYVAQKKAQGGKGLTKEDIPLLAGQALYNVAVKTADRMLPMRWDDLGDTNSMWDYIDEKGGMTFENFIKAVKSAAHDRLSEEGEGFGDLMNEANPPTGLPEPAVGSQTFNPGDMVYDKEHSSYGTVLDNYGDEINGDRGDIRLDSDGNVGIWQYDKDWNTTGYNLVKVNDPVKALDNIKPPLDEKSKSRKQQRFMGMVHAVQKGELSPEEVGGGVEKVAASMSNKDAEDFASTKHKGLPEKVSEEVTPDRDTMVNNIIAMDAKLDPKDPPTGMEGVIWKKVLDTLTDNTVAMIYNNMKKNLDNKFGSVQEDTQTMVQANPMTMANKIQPLGDQSANMDTGARSSGGGMNESHEKLFEEMNEELEAYSIHHNKLMKMSEDRKPSALVLKDRLGSENVKNFKSDLQQSGTKEIIDVEKELQYKDQQTDVGDDPQKLGLDIEKKEIVNTDAEGDEFLKNAGDSDNDKGDEIPKRNMTTKEQHEVDMMRQGQQDLVFDNEPSKRFEDRMKADMGDTLYKIRQEKMKYRAKAPMYNKDTQPTEVSADKNVQFDKNKSGWNEREGLMETMVTGRFIDDLGKKFIKDFRLNEAKELKTPSGTARQTGLFELDFTGFGNKYKNKSTDDYKVSINEEVEAILTGNKYYTNGVDVFFIKNPVQKLNETEQKTEKPKINEQVDKMKHLLGYKPNEFVSTKNVKNNRGF